jgi:hypothetical protein
MKLDPPLAFGQSELGAFKSQSIGRKRRRLQGARRRPSLAQPPRALRSDER